MPKRSQTPPKYPNHLREQIHNNGLRLTEVAQETDIPLRTLSDYCAGKLRIPRQRLEEFARIIGCVPDEIVPKYEVIPQENFPASFKLLPPVQAILPVQVVEPQASLLLLNKAIAPELPMLYDSMETEILIVALRWTPHDGSIESLQQRIATRIKDYDIMTHQHEGNETKLSRRHALQAIAKLPIQAYTLTALGTESLRLPPAEEFLPLCAAGLTACRSLLYGGGRDTVPALLATYLPTLETMARSAPTHHKTAADLASQAYLMATIIADHDGHLDHMEAYSKAARNYGHIAHDPNLEVSALCRLAVKYDYQRRDWLALQTYQEALALPGIQTVSPLLRGRLFAGLAGTYAYCFQKENALNTLSMARDMYPTQPEEDPCFQFAYSGSNTLSLWEGLTYKHVGLYQAARDAFGSRLEAQPGFLETNRAEFVNYAASVAVRQKELDTASLYLNTAEEIAWATGHQQRYSEVLETFRSVQLVWPDEARVKLLQDKIYSRQSSF
jgi:tetratricopeptide (TPR) repeat protein